MARSLRLSRLSSVLAFSAALVWLALPAPTSADAALQSADEHDVAISAFTFQPAVLTVNVGESVTWMNTDGVPHTSTAALNHLWGHLVTSTDSFTYTFDTPGTYAYFCEMHPAMVGSINVVGE
jgi:plastocyanin